MTLLGGIQRRHLPGQIVIPRPGHELVNAHRHTTPRRQPSCWRSVATVRTASRAGGVSHSGSLDREEVRETGQRDRL